ncbi:uncharacterized protein H6S33_008770 [Morchella sextelata]|uniref:uncharacterized protein n=1 Tax=Morchella sextelata TaxID=1174677 RepID=UPI001D0479F9|nr:uncharacterized protein H6S33_008770 [Morchella sextelata]KAH0602431.1 hypothetical protein H6S33_008770 [Morchella sextelata]
MEKTTMGLSDTTTGTTGTILISSMSSTPQPSTTSAPASSSAAAVADAAATSNDCCSPSSRQQTDSSSSPPRKSPRAEITTATATAMASRNGLSLESLPLEVIHQIFSLLTLTDLTSLRLTSRPLCSSATANPHWRHHFTNLLPAHAALLDVAAIPPSAWSFAHVPDGYFRAYTTLVRTAREDWLHSDQDLKGTLWMVLFKAFLKEGGARSDDPNYHTLIEMRADCTSIPLEGQPLNSSSWYVDGRPSLRFPCYPPNVPSRDPFTWCRIMQHVSVLMLTDSPDLLENLVHLNTSILNASNLPEAQRDARIKTLQEANDAVLENRKKGFSDRLKTLHLLRSERNSSTSGGGYSNAELPELDGVVNGSGSAAAAAAANEEESDWSHDNGDGDEEEWSDGEGGGGEYSYIFGECVLFQHIQQQHARQNTTLAAASPAESSSSGEGAGPAVESSLEGQFVGGTAVVDEDSAGQ